MRERALADGSTCIGDAGEPTGHSDIGIVMRAERVEYPGQGRHP